jgi:hypothetical protein
MRQMNSKGGIRMEARLANRIDQLMQYLIWYNQGRMERWQIEDYFKEFLDEAAPKDESE